MYVPDRAEYFTIERNRNGRGLDIEFYRPQDVTTDVLPRLRNVSELPGLLRKVDQAQAEQERAQVVEIRAQLELIIKRIDDHV